MAAPVLGRGRGRRPRQQRMMVTLMLHPFR